jgi:ribose transport system permease protein
MQSSNKAATLWGRVRHSSMLGTVVALLIVIVVMSFASDTFFTGSNLVNLVRQGAVLAVVAIGQTYVIISGGIDLSVAPLISLSTVLTASLVTNNGVHWGAAAVVAILACTLCGILNGAIITFIKIPPIIATLATTMAYQGICLLYTNGYGINLPTGNNLTAVLGRGKLLGIPVSGFVMVAMYVIFFIVLKYTKMGRVTYGLGGNTEAVRLSGVSTARYSVQVYAISGLLSGVAGVMLTARLNSGHSYNGDGFDMDSIAAAVLGGVSVAGGTGSLWGTLIGVFILTMITNGLNMVNLNTYIQMIIKGLIIIAAIGFGSVRSRKK